MRKCDECLTPYTDEHTICPGCGKRLPGYDMENPVSRLPMENILRSAAHLLWILGVIGFLLALWNTDQKDESLNWLIAAGGGIFLLATVIASIALFGMGEMLRRVIRIQRRVRAFVEGYNNKPE